MNQIMILALSFAPSDYLAKDQDSQEKAKNANSASGSRDIPTEVSGIQGKVQLHAKVAEATYRVKDEPLKLTVTIYWLDFQNPKTKESRRIWQQVRHGDERNDPDGYLKKAWIWGQSHESMALTFFNGWAVQFFELDANKSITPFSINDAGEYSLPKERIPDVINFPHCFNLLHVFRKEYGIEEGTRRLWLSSEDATFTQVTKREDNWRLVVSIRPQSKEHAVSETKDRRVKKYVFILPKGEKAWKLIKETDKKPEKDSNNKSP